MLGNNHYSRTLKDYPYLNDPAVDTMVSPPNRADLQNTDSYNGAWLSRPMFNEQQVTQNKFPFASIPHYVRYIDPETGEEAKVAGIPVEQAGSWEEGYQGSVSGGFLKNYDSLTNGRKQYFVIAHDGDNSSGRAGGGGTYLSSGNVTYSEAGMLGMGVNEYLRANPIPATDIVHVQDGSWIDTRDSSSDPQWHHWKLPPCIWKGQFPDFNTAKGFTYAPKNDFNGNPEGMTVSLEYGYHYLERNFALLQAAENYAKTAEQIWLTKHPSYWKPTAALDYELVGKNNTANQLNPYMLSFPIKGDAANDYKGGANPAELAWYFLIASIDSGFGYYDENIDDGVKPTISFNQSLYFAKPYVAANLAQDKTGPSVWWPQRWPYNPGSVNKDKSEGWSLQYFDTNFSIYTYAYDVNGMKSVKLKVRPHTYPWTQITAMDKTYKLYNPSDAKYAGDPNVVPSRVGAWVEYPMIERDLKKEINGVDWQPSGKQMFQKVPAQEIGNLFYCYVGPEYGHGNYKDQIIDYYIEATDSLGNVTKSPIQQVYVGMGKFKKDTATGKIVEDANGDISGKYPFVTDKPPLPPTRTTNVYIESTDTATVVMQYKKADGTWSASIATSALNAPNAKYKTGKISFNSTLDEVYVRYSADGGVTWKPSATGVKLTSGTWTIYAAGTAQTGGPAGISFSATVYYKGTANYIHWRATAGTWTVAPGTLMVQSEFAGYMKATIDLGLINTGEVCFNTNNANWDSNGGKNYIISAGDNTVEGSVVKTGKPVVVVDTTAPTVALTAPAAGVKSGTIAVSANATDNIGVTKVIFYAGTAIIGQVTTSPYTMSWNTTSVANGSYVIKAEAYDAANNKGTSATVTITVTNSTVDTTAPTVSLTAPAAGTVSGTITVSASASDNVGVTNVIFYQGSTVIGQSATAPYSVSWNTANVANGSYVIKAEAYDAANNKGTSSTVTVTVNNSTVTGFKVHLKRPTAWTNATIYYWNCVPALTAVTWPGVAMTAETNGWYVFTINANSASLIFSNNGASQTANLTRNKEGWFKDNVWYDTNPDSVVVKPFKVHLYKPTTWTSAYVYYWNCVPSLAAVTWPGVAMTDEGSGWYVFTVNANSASIIFSNKGSNQTVDLTRNKEGWYKNNVWYDVKP